MARRCRRRSSSARPSWGIRPLALLDRDGLYGAPQFYRAAKAAGLKAIVGAELTMGRLRRRPAGAGATIARRPVDAARAGGERRGLSAISAASSRARKLRAAKGERGVRARRFRRPDRRARRARGPRSAARRAAWRGRAGRSAGRRVRPRSGLDRTAAAPAARRAGGRAVAARSGRGVSRAGHGVQRRAVRDARGAAALRRAHQHPAQDARWRVRAGGWRSMPSGI